MTLAVLLVLGGLVCLMLEVLLVSFGMLALLAAALGIGGVVAAFEEGTAFGYTMLGALIVGGPIAVWGAFRLLPHLPFARGFYLRPPALTEAERQAAAPPATSLLGKTGEATSPLRPSGSALIEGRVVAVVADGSMVAAGSRVKVVDVSGNRVVVREIPRDAS